jgi:hypothetical protein
MRTVTASVLGVTMLRRRRWPVWSLLCGLVVSYGLSSPDQPGAQGAAAKPRPAEACGADQPAAVNPAAALRLVPFPQQIQLGEGVFALNRPLTLSVPAKAAGLFGELLIAELRRAGLPAPQVVAAESRTPAFRLAAEAGAAVPALAGLPEKNLEAYILRVDQQAITASATSEAGLFYGLQILCQLIRANRRGDGVPCLTVRDWPALRWRCLQDDFTRGPSPRSSVLRLQVDLGANLKLNLFTYYMEHQFAHAKHPDIGPPDGSVTPEEMRDLVAYAKPRHMDILGNQQSFGHFGHILKHERYAALRETPDILCPLKEESYQLLDDLYADICPLLPFPMFNVCCDETYGLGTGPAKELAEKIGVGGVYVRHMRRVHDLLKDKHGKRMMMWGDIILQHPDKLAEIPKDTVMLTWAYDPRANFESQIVPFAKSGYEFFVCPGVSNWSRILPDFGMATTNIRNFVRDGVKHGAIGMLNTDWEDDSESLNAPTWHGDAWGAECSWTGSATRPEDFNRRIGGVLFGEPGDHFGQAIELLSQTHKLTGMNAMHNSRFWQNDFRPERNPATIRESARRLLELVVPAIEHLQTCRREATANARLLDYFLFGARRMEFIGQRMLDGLEAVHLYHDACERPPAEALPLLDKVEKLVRTNRDQYESLGRQFAELWLEEAKPFALDGITKRYAGMVKWFDGVSAQLAKAREAAQAGKPLPRPDQVGLLLPEAFARRTRPHEFAPEPLEPAAPWADTTAAQRLGLAVHAGSADRTQLPVEVDAAVPAELAKLPIRAWVLNPNAAPREVPAQLDPSATPGKARIALILPDRVATGTEVKLHVYFGAAQATALPQSVKTSAGPKGMHWLENDQVRLLLGAEGAHVYRWEVKRLEGRDLTMPGESSWFGFSDMHALRDVPFQLQCVARGPALVRYVGAEPGGLVKTFSLFAGTSWMEVVLNDPTGTYWEFDNPANFAADGPTPGTYLFSGGQTGPVGKQADGVPAQVKAHGAYWGIKFNRDRIALGLTTPETAAHFVIAPGSGAGGVGIEGSSPAAHFVTFAGLLEGEPAATMNQLRSTLDFKNQPRMRLYQMQRR